MNRTVTNKNKGIHEHCIHRFRWRVSQARHERQWPCMCKRETDKDRDRDKQNREREGNCIYLYSLSIIRYSIQVAHIS